MKILYIGKICDDELFKEKEKQQQPFFIAQYMYEKALWNEFKKNNNLDIETVSIYQTEYYPKDTLVFNKKPSKKDGIKYLEFINIPYLRELTYFTSACVTILKWVLINKNIKEKFIYTSCHFPPVSLAVVVMGKLFSVKKIVTFTDLSLFTYSKQKVKKMKPYKRFLMKPYLTLVNKLQKSYDAYILFSKAMNNIVNSKKSPSLVIEGIYNSAGIDFSIPKIKKNAIAHAGTLNREVGIETILDVFSLIEDENLELWLMGKGDMTDEIIRRAEIDTRIKYLGFMPRKEVFEKLREAKLLINFRDPSDLYTKYSFPSKMFEYLVSGTPVFTTKLEGIPDDYTQNMFTIKSFDNQELALKLIEILQKNDSQLNEIGERAKRFVLTEKNSNIQAKKIETFLKHLED
jgi:glycosyltransferase involved in cell wall biosynthesis